MSYHVYVAKEGFKDNPISENDFLSAARECSDLSVDLVKNRRRPFYLVTLKADKKARINRTPYGLLDAQHPSIELVTAMFRIAGLLQAGVYSEELDRYQSVDDWKIRTESYRAELDRKRAVNKRRKWIRIFLLVLVAIIGASIGLFVKANGAGK